MAKRKKRKAAEQFPEQQFVIAPEGTPEWVLHARAPAMAAVEIDRSIAYDEPPESIVEAASEDSGLDDDPERNARLFWKDMPNLLARVGSPKIYGRSGIWRTAFKEIPVMKDGEPIGWYDLDGGLVEYATLYDLILHKQPKVVDDRKLFLMTEEMWESGEYPPEVGGKTTSKER